MVPCSLSTMSILLCIILLKGSSHLTVTLMCFNNFNKTKIEENEEILKWQRHKILYWKYMSSISQFINDLYYWIYSSYILRKKLNKVLLETECFILKLKITLFYFPSFFFIRSTTLCHSLSLIVSVVSLCHSLSLVVTSWHSLSGVVPVVVILCY